jgi:Holliday junction resolvase RusA-like endonuclease
VVNDTPAQLVVYGAPRTKKTSNRIVRAGRRRYVLPSEPHQRWFCSALPQLKAQWRRLPLAVPIGVRAIFYRDRAAGDLCNYMQALADALERAGVVKNDRLIGSWDGSRLRKDARHPRIEIAIDELTGEDA